MSDINKEIAIKALELLNKKMIENNSESYYFILGGGGAIVFTDGGENDVTSDLDADPVRGNIEEIKPLVEEVAIKLGLSSDWLNSYYNSFKHYLPTDYNSRLVGVFSAEKIKVDRLGTEDLIVMKLMAGRNKDYTHIKQLLKNNSCQLSIIEERILELKSLHKDRATKALNLFDKILEEEGYG